MSAQGENPDHLQPGTVLDGRYEILSVLGEGGFATVYCGRQRNIQREVAVKVLHQHSDPRSKQAFEDRFLREAQTAAQISHPNVVTIYDFGFTEFPRRPYIAMERLRGHDLEEELRENGPMEVSRAISLFTECLGALADAHRQGIVHKDLKPSNLYLTEPGSRRETLKLLDFGIARIQDVGSKRLTSTGQILGTPQYLAPEYIHDQTATPALDVYQMGLILVEMLTGKAVVDHDNPYKCLMVHGSGELEVPVALLNNPLGPVLLRALEKEHERRIPDAASFLKMLEQVDIASIPALPPGATTSRLSEVSGSFYTATAHINPSSTGSFGVEKSSGVFEQHERVPIGVAAGAQVFAPSDPPSFPGVQGAPRSLAPAVHAASPREDSSRLKGMIALAVGVVLLLSLSIAIVVVLGISDKKSDKDLELALHKSAPASSVQKALPVPIQATSPQTPVQAEIGSPVETNDAKEAQEVAVEKPASVEVQPIEPVKVLVKTNVPGATITQGDQILGTGHAQVEFHEDGPEAVALRISAAGYEPLDFELTAQGEPERSVVLEKVKAAPQKHARKNVGKGKGKAQKQTRVKVKETSSGTAAKKDSPEEKKSEKAGAEPSGGKKIERDLADSPRVESKTPKEAPKATKRPTMGFVE